MIHVHVSSLRPDRVHRTSVVVPFPNDPTTVAQKILRSFEDTFGGRRPEVKAEPQPEDIARWAKVLADAVAAGLRLPTYTDQRLVLATMLTMKGQPFVITSAGRSITVQPAGDISVPGGQPGQTMTAAK